MSKIISSMRIEPLHHRSPDIFEHVKVTAYKADEEPISFGFQEKYQLVATLAVNFKANSAQFERAMEAAKRMLAMHLHGETLAYLSELEHAVYSADNREDMISIIFKMREALTDVR